MPTLPVLPERRCDNCFTRYRPKQRLKKNDRHGFCCPNCKKQFHKFGGSYGKLKPFIETEIKKRIRELSPADALAIEAIRMRLLSLEEFCGRIRDAVFFCEPPK